MATVCTARTGKYDKYLINLPYMKVSKLSLLLFYITCWIALTGMIILMSLGHDGNLTKAFIGVTMTMFANGMWQVHFKDPTTKKIKAIIRKWCDEE